MLGNKTLPRGFAIGALAIGLSAALAQTAQATEFELTLSGVFNGTTDAQGHPVTTETLNSGSGGANVLTTPNERFTMTGVFDTSTGSLLPLPSTPPSAGFPSTGWVDYAPKSVTLYVGGTKYSVATYGDLPLFGLTVAVFDTTQMFGFGHYAAGFIQNPLLDGAGIVGDFLTATPNYSVPNLVPTTYGSYFGVGFGSGICSAPGSNTGCTPAAIPLDNMTYQLFLGGLNGYDLNDPSTGIPPDYITQFTNSHVFSAQLTAVPEPSTWALLLVGFAGLGYVGLRRGRKASLAV